jgi:hypothetical protein
MFLMVCFYFGPMATKQNRKRDGWVAAVVGCMLVAAVACLSHYGTSDALLEAAARSRAGELRRLDGLVSEVEAVKHALLGLEHRRAAARRKQQLAVRTVHRSQPAHTDSFDYSASVGHEPLGQGEWVQRDLRDDRLEMIPGRSELRTINQKVISDECRPPDCVTRSGLPLGSVLYPGAFRGGSRPGCRMQPLPHTDSIIYQHLFNKNHAILNLKLL